MTWELQSVFGIERIEYRDGVDWLAAPAPPKQHTHEAQARAWLGADYIERCACGAFGPSPWFYLGNDKPRVQKPRRWWRFW